MLEGIRANDIIAGAYTRPDGICPMLAAHRAGGRTSVLAFARAWDAFALGAGRDRAARRATERELRVLTAHLEASLLEDEGPAPGLADAIAEHRGLLALRHEDCGRVLARLERERARVARSARDKPLRSARDSPHSRSARDSPLTTADRG
jgi:hypothetical protein